MIDHPIRNSLSRAEQGEIWFESANPFEFYHILRELDKAPSQKVFGHLSMPDSDDERTPAVIACHGSWGWRAHHQEHLDRFLAMGIAVFRIHTFEARSVTSTAERQMEVTMATMLTDAFRALELLQTHPRILSDRIGVVGWSLGGAVATYSAWEPLREASVEGDVRFAAHLPIYPACHLRPREMRWSPAPMRILVGEAEDYTPARHCTELTEQLSALGRPAETIVYPGAYHSFDADEPVQYYDKVIALSGPTIDIAEDGHMVVTGTDHCVDEPEGRRAHSREFSCKGAHAGGNPTQRLKAFQDAGEFMKAHLLDA